MEILRKIMDGLSPNQMDTLSEFAHEVRIRKRLSVLMQTRDILEEPHLTSPTGFKLKMVPVLMLSLATEGTTPAERITYVSFYAADENADQAAIRRAMTIQREISRLQLLIPQVNIHLKNEDREKLQVLCDEGARRHLQPLPHFSAI